MCQLHRIRWPSPQAEQQDSPVAGAVWVLVSAGLQNEGDNDVIS